jgi:hypothetical protein
LPQKHPGCLRHRANLPFAPDGCKRVKDRKIKKLIDGNHGKNKG